MSTAPESSSESSRTVADLVKGIPFAMLTTLDAEGELVSRPMSHQDVEFDGNLWFVGARDSRKVSQIEADPHVSVTLASSSTWVSINGTAEIIVDPDKISDLWSAEMEAWFPQGPDDGSLVAIKVVGSSAEYWDTPGGRVATVISFAKAKLTGEPYNAGRNEKVDLDSSN